MEFYYLQAQELSEVKAQDKCSSAAIFSIRNEVKSSRSATLFFFFCFVDHYYSVAAVTHIIQQVRVKKRPHLLNGRIDGKANSDERQTPSPGHSAN